MQPSRPILVIVADDSEEARRLLMQIVETAGFPTEGASNLEGAAKILDSTSAGTRCLILLASAFASKNVAGLLRHERKPQLLMTCVRPPACPVAPQVECADLGCIQKPADFRDPKALVARFQQLLS